MKMKKEQLESRASARWGLKTPNLDEMRLRYFVSPY
jgi:hypothetical protein